MNYEPHKTDWSVGDLAIHDAVSDRRMSGRWERFDG